jgi:hypothetical protein
MMMEEEQMTSGEDKMMRTLGKGATAWGRLSLIY